MGSLDTANFIGFLGGSSICWKGPKQVSGRFDLVSNLIGFNLRLSIRPTWFIIHKIAFYKLTPLNQWFRRKGTTIWDFDISILFKVRTCFVGALRIYRFRVGSAMSEITIAHKSWFGTIFCRHLNLDFSFYFPLSSGQQVLKCNSIYLYPKKRVRLSKRLHSSVFHYLFHILRAKSVRWPSIYHPMAVYRKITTW